MTNSGSILRPIIAVIQRGTELYAEGPGGNVEHRASCANLQTASWIGWLMSQALDAPHKIEPAEDLVPGRTEIDEMKRRQIAQSVLVDLMNRPFA